MPAGNSGGHLQLSSSAAAAPLAVDAAVGVGHVSLARGEELLGLSLEGLISGGRERLLSAPGKRTGLRSRAGRTFRPGTHGGTGAPGGRTLRGRQGLLDGKIDLSVVCGQDHDLDSLSLL